MKQFLLFITLLFIGFNASAADYFWVGGSGNWNQIAHWATTSGGSTLHATVPSGTDDVYFDSNSFTTSSETVSLNTAANCKDFNTSNALFKPEFTGTSNLNIYGSLSLIDSIIWDIDANLNFYGTGSHTINFSGHSPLLNIYFRGLGTYSLLDTINMSGTLFIRAGTFNTDGFNITSGRFYADGTVSTHINFGASIITTTISTTATTAVFAVNLANTLLTMDADSCEFVLKGNSFYTNFRALAKDSIHKIKFTKCARFLIMADGMFVDTVLLLDTIRKNILTGELKANYIKANQSIQVNDSISIRHASLTGNLTLNNSARFDTLILTGERATVYQVLESKSLIIIDSISFPIGNCQKLYAFQSSSPTVQANIIKTTGSVLLNYTSLSSINASGGASFISQSTPSEDGNNTGWTIFLRTPVNYYWVGNTGNWNNPQNWSLSSGGTPQSASGCVPNVADSVFFDANSFATTGHSVTLDIQGYCGFMSWENATNNPRFTGTFPLYINGSLVGNPVMNWDIQNSTSFVGSGSHTINLKGQILKDVVYLDCNGTYELRDSLNTEGLLNIRSGKLVSNSFKIHAEELLVNGPDSLTLLMGESTIEVDLLNNKYQKRSFILNKIAAFYDFDSTTILLNGAGDFNNAHSEYYVKFGDIIIYQSTDFLTLRSSHIDSLIFMTPDAKSIVNSSVRVANLIAHSDVLFNKSPVIEKAEVFGDFTTSDDISIDTLIFFPTKYLSTYSLARFKTCTVADSIRFPSFNCKKSYVLQSTRLGAGATLSKATGSVFLSGAVLNSISATGGASFFSNNTLQDDGNNTGWTINMDLGKTFYWVVDTGDWNDPTCWSFTSGGTAQLAGGCLPRAVDSVIFDANSFAGANPIVNIDSTAICGFMNWGGAANSPSFMGSHPLYIFGSLTAIPSMNWDITGTVTFKGADTSFIDFTGQVLNHHVVLNTSTVCNLRDSLHTSLNLVIQGNEINFNDHNVHCSRLVLNTFQPTIVNLGTSLVEVAANYSSWYKNSVFIDNPNLQWNGLNATIDVNGAGSFTSIICRDSITFGKVILRKKTTTTLFSKSTIDSLFLLSSVPRSVIKSKGKINYLYGQSDVDLDQGPHIKTLELDGQLRTLSDVTVDTLLLLKTGTSSTHTFLAGTTLTINDSVFINSGGCFKHNLVSSNTNQTNFSMPAGKQFVADFIGIRGIDATGGANFDAGANGTDLGNNTGWNFSASRNTLRLKYRYYCLTPGYTKEIKANPDGNPTKLWWRRTIAPFDTFNVNVDTLIASAEADYIYVMEYGAGCKVEDSVFIRFTSFANGLAQTFKNQAKDKDWFNCSNWDNGLIPDSISNATIDAGDTVRITKDTAWCNDLIINGVFEQTGGIIMVFGDLVNNGVVNQTGGKIVMAGSGSDSIKGANMLTLDSLELNKNGYCYIARRTWINKNMDFVKGYAVTNSTEDLRFLRFATSNGGNNTSFAVGPVYKFGSEAFVFPIGHGSKWARLGISDEQTTVYSPLFRAEYFKLLPTDTGSYIAPVKRVSSVEYWLLNKVSGKGSYKVKLFFEEANFSGIQNTDSAIVIKYDGSDWINKGNTSNLLVSGKGYIESDYVTTFSPFTFGTVFNNNTLPVELLKFEVTKVANDGVMTWTTAQEVNNSHFEIMRSIDNIYFTKIGEKISLEGNSSNLLEYTFTDHNIHKLNIPMIYYKLKQVDENGTTSSSETRFIEGSENKKVFISPNPSIGEVDITTHGSGKVEIVNVLGELVYTETVLAGQSSLRLNLSHLTSGTYIIQFVTETETERLKLVLH